MVSVAGHDRRPVCRARRKERARGGTVRMRRAISPLPLGGEWRGVGGGDQRPDAAAKTGPERRRGDGAEVARGALQPLRLRYLILEKCFREMLRPIGERSELLPVALLERRRRRRNDLL